jgi:hypothetical protein
MTAAPVTEAPLLLSLIDAVSIAHALAAAKKGVSHIGF